MEGGQQPLPLLGTLISALREFLRRIVIPFKWIEFTSDTQARVLACLMTSGWPSAFFRSLSGWSMRQSGRSAKKVGWLQKPSRMECDLAILGGGSAGLSAAV